MSTINKDTQQRLRELITTIAMDEAHMIFDDSRDRVVNKLVELARLIHIPLFLMTGTTHYQCWQILTMRLDHKLKIRHKDHQYKYEWNSGYVGIIGNYKVSLNDDLFNNTLKWMISL
jgi:hypothetical protein